MKNMIRSTLVIAAISAALCASVRAQNSSAGTVDFGKFTAPGSGGEFIEVQVKSNLISMVARMAEKAEPEIAQVLRGLQGVRVNVIGLDEKNRAEIADRVKAIRAELDSLGWERVATVQGKNNQDIAVFIKLRKDEAVEGLAVTVIEGRQAVLVNVVGDIKPEQVALVGERFNIEPLKKVGMAMNKK